MTEKTQPASAMLSGTARAAFNDEVLGKMLCRQIEEALVDYDRLPNDYIAFVCANDNQTVRKGERGTIDIDDVQELFARSAVKMLNTHARMDGAWVAVWGGIRSYTMRQAECFILIWKDRDGDDHFTRCIDFDARNRLEDCLGRGIYGPEWLLESAELAKQAQREHIEAAGVRPEQMIKRALGQQSTFDRSRQ